MYDTLINICNRTKSNQEPDFKSIPPARIFKYKNRCYDLKKTISAFNDGCLTSGYYFHITPLLALSYGTMRDLSKQTLEYNRKTTDSFHNRSRYQDILYVDHDNRQQDNIRMGKPIEITDFMNLLMHDLCEDRPSTICKEIITYDMSNRSRQALIYLKVIYIFMNHYRFIVLRTSLIYYSHVYHVIYERTSNRCHVSLIRCISHD